MHEILIVFFVCCGSPGLQSWPAAGPWTRRRGPSFSSWFSAWQSSTQRWAPTCRSKTRQITKNKSFFPLHWRPWKLVDITHTGKQPRSCALWKGGVDFFNLCTVFGALTLLKYLFFFYIATWEDFVFSMGLVCDGAQLFTSISMWWEFFFFFFLANKMLAAASCIILFLGNLPGLHRGMIHKWYEEEPWNQILGFLLSSLITWRFAASQSNHKSIKAEQNCFFFLFVLNPFVVFMPHERSSHFLLLFLLQLDLFCVRTRTITEVLLLSVGFFWLIFFKCCYCI